MQLHGDEDVNLSYKYMMSVDPVIQDNMLVEDAAYEWAPKRWSYCSKLCGGGRWSRVPPWAPSAQFIFPTVLRLE